MALRKSGSEQLANTTTAGTQIEPSATALTGGGFAIAWMDDSETGGDTFAESVRAQVFTANGSKLGPEFVVNTTTNGSQRLPALDAQTAGGFMATFDTGGLPGSDIAGRLFDAAGNPRVNGVNATTDEFPVNTTTSGNQISSALAELAGGRMVVAFNSQSQIRARLFDAAGMPVVNGVSANTNDFLVDSNPSGVQFGPSAAALAGGGFIVTYVDRNFSGFVEARLFDASGNPAVNGITGNSNSFTVGNNLFETFTDCVGLAGGGFLVMWLSDRIDRPDMSVLFGRLFDASGTPVTIPGSSEAPGTFRIAVGPGHGSLAATPDGGFVVTYGFGSDIYAQLYDAGAQTIGSRLLVNTTTSGIQDHPTMSVLADGRMVVAWNDHSQTGGDPSSTAVRFQVLDLNAVLLPDSFNGDNFSDILWQNDNGTAGIWLMDGLTRVAGANVGFNPGPSWHVKAPGDFNADGKADILWQNDDGTAGIWLMDGFTVIGDGNVGFNPGPSWRVIDAGDFDGDRKSDILWQNDDGTAGIWLMNGLSRVAGANVGFNPGPSWHVKASGDFNADGKADILWQNDDGTAGIWLMDGLARIAGANVGFNPGPTWKVIETGDFNGDRTADILWQNENGQPGIWLMDGLTRIAGANVGFNPGPSWKVKTTGDYNGDDRSDILWQNDNGQPGIWLMDGFTVVADNGVGFNPGPSWHVVGQTDLI